MNTDKLKELEMAHTPEPWIYSHHANGVPYVFAEHHNRQTIATTYGDFDEANARRIVACVNACRGLSTEDLKKTGLVGAVGYQLINLESQRDELLAALVALEKRAAYMAHQCGHYQSEVAELVAAKTAIAKAVQS